MRACGALAVAAIVLCAAPTPAHSFELGGGEPVAQFGDTVRTYASKPIATLHVTADAEGSELTWAVGSLPCAGQRFRLEATEGQVASTQASAREVGIRIVSAHFSRGLHCGAKLPSSANEGSARVTVKPLERVVSTAGPANAYEDSETKVDSFSACMTLASECPGVYVLRGYIDAPRLHAWVEYAFNATPVGGPPADEGPRETLQPLQAPTERFEQCPVPSRER